MALHSLPEFSRHYNPFSINLNRSLADAELGLRTVLVTFQEGFFKFLPLHGGQFTESRFPAPPLFLREFQPLFHLALF
jgi:hypothetical protein